ncbi:hypothetical protein [Paramaledivibacter caminithermalis]|jgi:hypothetical protein|uniref:Uncharacterized protein n=1 Tax=Paramaledivibacter caminithermalis (strain DSM 15212 / CIP 107654 / DViRD3) TaxID=1121301 RepID=A0A1M6L4M0_PARC5|nr:hypothetical protein [Paramaledivibacter caminithermalis]SHJ66147.1 hypothetical protein SAMN02745912_00649 [Paramaledivibacter caminithermalis DSM 15212]
MYIDGGEIIKVKIYIISIIILTFITTYTIMHFQPTKNDTLAKEKYYGLSNFIAGIKNKTPDKSQDDCMIDGEVLNGFIKLYSNKSIEDLEIYEKEEIKYILETMGSYNTIKLKKLLQKEPHPDKEKIHELLNENLFDKDLMLLNEMLKLPPIETSLEG